MVVYVEVQRRKLGEVRGVQNPLWRCNQRIRSRHFNLIMVVNLTLIYFDIF